MTGYRVNAQSIKTIRANSDIVRRIHNKFVDDGTYFNIVEFIELILPIIDDDFVLEISTKEELKNNHGEAYPDDHLIKIREDVYFRAIEGSGRDRFTMAHELGHYLMHSKNQIKLARNGSDTIQYYEDSEWQANTFAAELLMPINKISPADSIKDISERFGVTYKAAEVRLKKLGYR